MAGSSISMWCSIPDLPDELEDQPVGLPVHVPPLERGQPEAAVLVGVDVVADPEVPQVQQAYGDRTRTRELHPLGAEVGEHPLASPRQRLAEAEHPVELLGVPAAAPVRVVEVLPAPGLVGADRLQVAVLVRRDPDVLPRRRDDQVAHPLGLRVGEPLAVLVEVEEALPGPSPGPARFVGRGPPEARHGPQPEAAERRCRAPGGVTGYRGRIARTSTATAPTASTVPSSHCHGSRPRGSSSGSSLPSREPGGFVGDGAAARARRRTHLGPERGGHGHLERRLVHPFGRDIDPTVVVDRDRLALRLRGHVELPDLLEPGVAVDLRSAVVADHEVPAVGEERAVGGDRQDVAELAHPVRAVGAQLRRRGVQRAAQDALAGHEQLARPRVGHQGLGVPRRAGIGQLVGLPRHLDVLRSDGEPGDADRRAVLGVVADVADPDAVPARGRERLHVLGLARPADDPDRPPVRRVHREDPAGVAGVVGRDEQPVLHDQPARLDDLRVLEAEHLVAVVGRRRHGPEDERHDDRHCGYPLTHPAAPGARRAAAAPPTSRPARRTPCGRRRP